MLKIVCISAWLFLAPPVYFFANGQNTKCITTLSIPVVFEKIILPPDTVRNVREGISDYIRSASGLRIATSNKSIAITSFKVTVVKLSGDVIEVMNTGSDLNTSAASWVQGAKKGETILFECIQAQSAKGKIYTLLPLIITL